MVETARGIGSNRVCRLKNSSGGLLVKNSICILLIFRSTNTPKFANISPFPEHVAAREEMPGGRQEFLDGPQTSDHVRAVFASFRGGGASSSRKSRKWALDSIFLLILLQTAPKDLYYQTFRSIRKS
jgi:hypothetical protein